MDKQKKKTKTLSAFILLFAITAVLTGAYSTVAQRHKPVRLSNNEPCLETFSTWSGGQSVVPVGRAVGIKLFSDGVLVVGLSPIETENGGINPGKRCGLKAGDVIRAVEGAQVDTIEQVQQLVAQGDGKPLSLQVFRGERNLQLSIEPAQTATGEYKLGVWLKDSMAGIGTVTFYDPASGTYAALGHPISDADTGQIMPLQSGSLMPATVSAVTQGQAGKPGELQGIFDVNESLGNIITNTQAGIYGTLESEKPFDKQAQVPLGTRKDVSLGSATILANVEGDTVEEFDIEIIQLYAEGTNDCRNLMLRITDPKLLSVTGGIVQGMSGSPILQNGKLIGAVTHVLINDPTRGYGILAENMITLSNLPQGAKAS